MSRQSHSPSLNTLNAFLITFFLSFELASFFFFFFFSFFSSSSCSDDVIDSLSTSRLSPSSSSSSSESVRLLFFFLSAGGFSFLTGRSFEIERESSSSSSDEFFLLSCLIFSVSVLDAMERKEKLKSKSQKLTDYVCFV